MSVTEVSRRESRCDFGVSHTTPTRPDPTRPLISSHLPSIRHLVKRQTAPDGWSK